MSSAADPVPTPAPAADLHVHSHYSDGTDAPDELLRRAARHLELISICDHDTIAAYDHLPAHADIRILVGVEVSAHHRERGLHILGYFPHGMTPGLRARAAAWEADRRRRIERGVHALRESGVPLRWKQLEACVGVGVPCRSHVARALVELGVGRSPHGLYERYLGAERFGLPAADVRAAIAAIRDEGGVAVWAHPDGADVARFGDELVELGLQGVESRGRHRTPAPRRRLLEAFRERHGLFATGGSDYHCQGPRFRLGQFRWPLAEMSEALRG